MPDVFEKFTGRARKVFSLAQEEALRLNHNYIGTEHLLLGLVREGDGIAARVLANLGVQLPKARGAIEALVQPGKAQEIGNPNLTPRAKRVIELAMGEARNLNNHFIGTEHLLLGLILARESTAVLALTSMSVSSDDIQRQVMQVVSQSASWQAHRGEPAPTLPPRTADTFEKFTERARHVFSLAQEEARRFNHNYIGTEHLLLGLVREGDGIAARVLANLRVQLPKVRSAVEFIIGRGDGLVVGDPGLTPRAKKVIELAMDEARRLNNRYIGTEHLLLGLVREGEGIAAGVLGSLGVSLEKVRQQTMVVVSQASGQPYTMSSVTCQIDIPLKEYTKLRHIAVERGSTVDRLILEAIRNVWLTNEEGDTEAMPES